MNSVAIPVRELPTGFLCYRPECGGWAHITSDGNGEDEVCLSEEQIVSSLTVALRDLRDAQKRVDGLRMFVRKLGVDEEDAL